eukprot:Blabericola_migrator_1__8993@NODE_478_length_8196_cov_107_510026_g372_i0_p5_GENE_NODE_478_length_8196_cov_107_510026_g372_i0NODE_478_length_8196_cov_107_510026_g372_i0_p5_ORF_typecomplete_len176_score11_40PAM2/PF07145_15/7_3e03PAM2/PF07145_15/6_4e07_NODE_478_length_8196_cov_107_510026_g372_i048685395
MLPTAVTREGLLISTRFPVKNTFISFNESPADARRDTVSEGEAPRPPAKTSREHLFPLAGEFSITQMGCTRSTNFSHTYRDARHLVGSSTKSRRLIKEVAHQASLPSPAWGLSPPAWTRRSVPSECASSPWMGCGSPPFSSVASFSDPAAARSTLNPNAPEFIPREWTNLVSFQP